MRRRDLLSPFALVLLLPLAPPLNAATLLVGNKAEASVSLLDAKSGATVAVLPVGTGPHEIAVSPDGKRALVANYGNREVLGSTLTLLDVPGSSVVKTIDLAPHQRPHGLLFLDGRRALVTSETSKALLIVDVESGKVEKAIETGQETSHMVAATPDGKRAFTANIGSGSTTAIDLVAGKTLASIPTGAGAEGIDVTPDGKQVIVTNRAADSVSVVDVATLKVVATLESKSFPIRVKVTPDGKRALVSNAKSGDLSLLSVAGRKVERRIALPAQAVGKDDAQRLLTDFGDSSVPVGVLIEPDGKRAFVAHANGDVISVVDLKTFERIATWKAGKEPDGMGYSKLDARKPAAK